MTRKTTTGKGRKFNYILHLRPHEAVYLAWALSGHTPYFGAEKWAKARALLLRKIQRLTDQDVAPPTLD